MARHRFYSTSGTSLLLPLPQQLPPTAAAFTAAQCESLLYQYAANKSLPNTKKLHAHIIRSGLLSCLSYPYIPSLLTSSYALCGHIVFARTLFDEMTMKTLRSCNTLIKLYTERGLPYNALQMFGEMMNSGHPKPNYLTYPFAVKACGDILYVQLGALIHGLIIINVFSSDTFVGNSLLAMYMNFGKKDGAARVFDSLCEKTVVSWNTMISGYFRNDGASESLRMFKKMVEARVEVDCATVVSVLPACGYLKEVKVGREVHELMEKKGLEDKLSAKNALVDMYVKCNKMDEARGAFDKISDRDVVTWTSMMNDYILNGDARSAIELCPQMHVDGVRPNAVTLASLLSACGDLVDSKRGQARPKGGGAAWALARGPNW